MVVNEILATISLAAAPVGELRFAIPWSMLKFEFAWYQAFTLALIGNLVPVFILPWTLSRMGRVILTLPTPIGQLFRWRTAHLRKTASTWFARYGYWSLLPFVATPLPFTGAWTGCLVAWALDVPPKKSIPVIALGLLIAAVIVTTITELGISISGFLGYQPG